MLLLDRFVQSADPLPYWFSALEPWRKRSTKSELRQCFRIGRGAGTPLGPAPAWRKDYLVLTNLGPGRAHRSLSFVSKERAFEAFSATPLSTVRATVTEHDVCGRLAIHTLCRAIEYSSQDSIRIVHLEWRSGVLP